MSGKEVAVIRMCVAVKRRLYLYYWKKPGFVLFENSDLTLKDIPKTLVWCEETICVGYKGEYCLHKVTYNNASLQFDNLIKLPRIAGSRFIRFSDLIMYRLLYASSSSRKLIANLLV